MRTTYAAQILATIQAFDNRRVDEATVTAWADLLPDHTADDYIQAVKDHYQASTEWLMPANLIVRVKSVRSRRIEVAGSPHLRNDDENNHLGERRSDATQKQQHLTSLIASGSVSAELYRGYESGRLSFDDLDAMAQAQSRQINKG